MNRYSYVVNNPLKYTDPTGHAQACEDGDICWSPNTTPTPAPSNGTGHHRHHQDDDEDDAIPGWYTGVYCNDTGCFFDGVTDISGTYQDPAIYISLAAGGVGSGLFKTMGSGMYLACLRIYACANTLAHITGITVYRVWGGTAGPVGGSPITRPGSWTPINPLTIVDYANRAGLPPGNSTQYLSIGTIYSMENVSIVAATEIGTNAGGLLEYSITNPQVQVFVQEVINLFH